MTFKAAERLELNRLIYDGDIAGIDDLLAREPDILELGHILGETWIHEAARSKNAELVRYFVNAGVDLNAPLESRNSPCALSAAVSMGDLELVRWMISKGANANLSSDPMVSAVSKGHLDIVKLLIQHGADYNCVFGSPPRTPLSQAMLFRRHEIAEYLRSLGAIMPPEPSRDDSVKPTETSSAEKEEEILAYFAHHTRKRPHPFTMQEIIPGKAQISVGAVEGEDCNIIFTIGMSFKPMTVPAGCEEYRYAELLMYLPKHWPMAPEPGTPESWPHRWLRTIAHFPHEQNTWLAAPVTTFSNGDPPQPLDPSCNFSAFVVAYNLAFKQFRSDDGRTVNMITAIPIYAEECALAKASEDGFAELFRRFDREQIGSAFSLNRPNVGKP